MAPGLRVIAANSAPCLRCFHCRRGQENLCEDLLFNNGAYAEYMRIPGRIVMENMLEVPHSVDDGSAALVELWPACCAAFTKWKAHCDTAWSSVAAHWLDVCPHALAPRRARDCSGASRRSSEVARRMGAIATINVTEVRDVVGAVRNLTRTSAARIPCRSCRQSGHLETSAGHGAARRRGEFLQRLALRTRVEIEPAAIHYSEIKLISPFHHTPRFIREALEAIRRGDILAHDFVTEEIRLEDLPHAFEKMKSRSGESSSPSAIIAFGEPSLQTLAATLARCHPEVPVPFQHGPQDLNVESSAS